MATFAEDIRAALTIFAQGAERLKIVSDAFERRGAAAGLGNDALEIVTLNNQIQTFLDAPKRATISRLRTDVPDAPP